MDNRKQRELKFRAWDGSNMIQPADLFGDVRNELLIALNGSLFYFKEESNGNWAPSTLESFQKPDYKLMQFTGLTDKNGVEIYEGDVLKVEDPYGENTKVFAVQFKDGAYQIEWSSMFNGGDSDITAIGYAMQQDFTFEVIGNLYETPDLLTTQPNP